LDGRLALPANTVVDGSYRVLRVVGSGGFGITYEAEDTNLGTLVAIKEYYPAGFADRDATMSVRPKSDRHEKAFEWGRSSFLVEARTLARFRHPSVVQVTRVFEAYSTAYMVMVFEQGQDFGTWLKGLGRLPTQQELDRIAGPLLDALDMMHTANFLHRDIAPDNIIIRLDGTPVLLDFGAARRAVAEVSRSITGIVKAGYSPHEQYSADSRLQGPWSDIYALGATLYRAVTGRSPEESTLRVDVDSMVPASRATRGAYRSGFLSAIDASVRVKLSERPQSVKELRRLLLGQDAEGQERLAEIRDRQVGHLQTTERIAASREGTRRWKSIAAIVLVLLGGAYVGFEHTRWNGSDALLPGAGVARLAKEEHESATRRQAALDKERRLKEQEAADARQRQIEIEEARRRKELADAAEAEARRKAEAAAEAKRKEDLRIAALEDQKRRKEQAEAEAAETQRIAALEEAKRKEEARRKAEAEVAEKQRIAALEEAKRKEAEQKHTDVQISRLPTNVETPSSSSPPADRTALIRAVQTELKRIGCDPGAVDGLWGTKVRDALTAFALAAKIALPVERPTAETLQILASHKMLTCVPIAQSARPDAPSRDRRDASKAARKDAVTEDPKDKLCWGNRGVMMSCSLLPGARPIN